MEVNVSTRSYFTQVTEPISTFCIFLKVLGAESSQQEVFDAVGKRVADGCLAGMSTATLI